MKYLHIAQQSAILDDPSFDQHSQGCGLLALDGTPFLSWLLIHNCAVFNLLAESACNEIQAFTEVRFGSS